MLPNLKILAFLWRQFYFIASKKKFVVLNLSFFFCHTEPQIKKKKEGKELSKV